MTAITLDAWRALPREVRDNIIRHLRNESDDLLKAAERYIDEMKPNVKLSAYANHLAAQVLSEII